MRFPSALKHGRLIKRYKRFLADIELDNGETITATCPNTGSMLGLAEPGLDVWVSVSPSPTRKYPHTWELVSLGKGRERTLVGINTAHPNAIVAEAITLGGLTPLAGYASLRREVKYGAASRIDLLLEDPSKPTAYVEVKNVHLSRERGLAEFPDSRTERGIKHLTELSNMARSGQRAVMVYLIQRNDAQRFSLAADIDPAYAEAVVRARAAGVEAYAAACRITTNDIRLERLVPIVDL
jgi:sugar fermentation stimulation protein A